MIVLALIMSLVLAVVAGIFVFKKLSKLNNHPNMPLINTVNVKSERDLLIEGLRDVNKKLREQIYETETLNALLIQKAELEKKLDRITGNSIAGSNTSPIQPSNPTAPIQPR